MSSTIIPAPETDPRVLSPDECRAVVERSRFGHLAFSHKQQVEAVPIRFAFAEGWLYFRAAAVLRDAIAGNPWIAIAMTDALDSTHVVSVVARGGCYPTEQTGAATVLRMHVDSLRGRRTTIPDHRLSDTHGIRQEPRSTPTSLSPMGA